MSNKLQLADGRTFAQFLEADATNEIYRTIGEFGAPMPSLFTVYCLFSAMEYEFRMDRESKEFEKDWMASNYWYDQAAKSYSRLSGQDYGDGLVKTMRLLVNAEIYKRFQRRGKGFEDE